MKQARQFLTAWKDLLQMKPGLKFSAGKMFQPQNFVLCLIRICFPFL